MADYRTLTRQIAAKYGLDPNIFERQISKESMGFNADVIAGRLDSPAGARGIAQLMPSHWKVVDPKDPAASLDYAARLMSGYLKSNGGDYAKALASYNAGPGAVAKYGGVPPFKETQGYVRDILGDAQTPKPQGDTQMADPTIDPRIAAIEAQIAAFERDLNERDADGDPTPAAFAAQKALPGMYKQLLDWTKARSSSDPAANTSAWTILTKADGSKWRYNEITKETQPIDGFGPTPDQGQIVTASTSQRYITERDASGNYRNIANPNYVEPKEADPYASSTVIAAGISADTQANRLAFDKADFEWRQGQAELATALAERKMTFDEAKESADELYKRLDLDLKKSIAENDNEVALRGQDVTTRGQDMNYATNYAQNEIDAWKTALPHMAPAGSTAAFNTALGNVGNPNPSPVNVPGGAFPFDPQTIVAQAVARATGQIGGQFAIPGAPKQQPLPDVKNEPLKWDTTPPTPGGYGYTPKP